MIDKRIHPKPAPRHLPELRAMPDGVVEIWYRGELLGEIRSVVEGISVTLGDHEPGSSVLWKWSGEPASVRVLFGLAGASL